MKLYVDDERPCPPGWTLAENAHEALHTLRSYNYYGMKASHISFDHDYGICILCQGKPECKHDGYWLLKQIAEEGLWPKNKPTVHSQNPVGIENMTAFIDRYYPES